MTVSALYEPDVYNGDGSLDTFPITFDFLNSSTYIKVSLKNEIALTYTLCYEHLQYEMSGSNIVFNAGYIPTTDDIVIIEFNSDWLQNSDYVENSALPAENMEDDFDKLKLEVQALRDLTARALRVGPEVDLDLVDPRDYFDVALTPELEALGDQSAELLLLAADQSDLTDIAANWTPASASGAASLRFKEDTDNGTSGVYIKAPASLSGDITLTLPDSDGDADQVLKTDGSGNLSWTNPTSATPGGISGSIQLNNGTGGFTGTEYLTGSNGTINFGKASTVTGGLNLFLSSGNYYNSVVPSFSLASNTTFRLPTNNPNVNGGDILYGGATGYPVWYPADNLWQISWDHMGYGTPASGDYLMFQDVSDSQIKKKATLAEINTFLGGSSATTTVGSSLSFMEGTNNGTNYIKLKSPDALSGNTTLTLPDGDGDANQVMISDGSGTLSWSGVTDLVSAASDTVAGKIEIAVQSEMEAGTDTGRAVTPGRQHYHPSASKAWFYSADMSAGTITIDSSYNITSVTDNGTGDYTITIATDFSSTAFAVVATASTTAGAPLLVGAVIVDASNIRIRVTDHAGSATDANVLSVIMFGDQ